MSNLCEERGVKLLCYGTVLGGLLSEKWIGHPEPRRGDFTTVSEAKVSQFRCRLAENFRIAPNAKLPTRELMVGVGAYVTFVSNGSLRGNPEPFCYC